ncbi:MAG: hypothetical protein HUN04_09925 [Desulfobacter sp.]|nr:MAG: hypothetical protein HUN04_09925 [Desulfobacter sp.]
MNFRIRRSHELGGVILLWIYDILKYQIFGDLLESRGIDAQIFLFMDMVTVPAFVAGSARLINSLAGRALAWHKVMGWGLVVLFNTVLPYAYAAAAGKAQFDAAAWGILGGIILLVLANMIRTIWLGVVKKKKGLVDGKRHPGELENDTTPIG